MNKYSLQWQAKVAPIKNIFTNNNSGSSSGEHQPYSATDVMKHMPEEATIILSDSEDDEDSEALASASNLLTTSTKRPPRFKISIKSKDLQKRLEARGSETNTNTNNIPSHPLLRARAARKEQHDRRRSSVLKSLQALDVEEDEQDNHGSFNSGGGLSGRDRDTSHEEKPSSRRKLKSEQPLSSSSHHKKKTSKHHKKKKKETDADDDSGATSSSFPPQTARRASHEMDATGYVSDSYYGYASDDADQVQHRPEVTRTVPLPPVPRRQTSRRGSMVMPSQEDPEDDGDSASVSSMPPLTSHAHHITHQGKRRSYQRRGSVTNYSLENHLQNTNVVDTTDYGYEDTTADETASLPPIYGSVSLSTESGKRPMRCPRRGSTVTPTQEYPDDDGDSASVSSMPPLTSQTHPITNQGKRRSYQRRGSVTKYSLDNHLQNNKEQDTTDYGYGDTATDETASLPPISASASFSAEKPTRRYVRRCSVTKYSLEPSTSTQQQEWEKNDDDDSASVASAPTISSNRMNNDESGSRRYSRRGSVTRYSLHGAADLSNGQKNHAAVTAPSVPSKGTTDTASPANLDYGYEDAAPTPKVPNSGRGHMRRNSVTRYSLDHHLKKQNRENLENSENQDDNVDYGYGEAASVASLPPLSTSASFSTDPSSRQRRYGRRCSVTRYSLSGGVSDAELEHAANDENADDSSIHSLPTMPTSYTAAVARVPASASEGVDSDDDDLPVAKPGDDHFSENLEDSGRFGLRRSICVGDDDEKRRMTSPKKRPSLPKRSSLGSHIASQRIPTEKGKIKSKTNELEKDSGHVRAAFNQQRRKAATPNDLERDSGQVRRSWHGQSLASAHTHRYQAQDSESDSENDHVTPGLRRKKPLEDDSVHVKKTWDTPENNRDLDLDLDGDDDDYDEFGGEADESTPANVANKARTQRLPPRISPAKLKQPNPHQLSEFLEANPRPPSAGQKQRTASLSKILDTIDGHLAADDEEIPTHRIYSSLSELPPLDSKSSIVCDRKRTPVEKHSTKPKLPMSTFRRGSAIATATTAVPPAERKASFQKRLPSPLKNQKKRSFSKLPSLSLDQNKSGSPTSKNSSNAEPKLPPTNSKSAPAGILKTTDSGWGHLGIMKQVRFGSLKITEFPIILGDNPAVTSGAPITIDWEPQRETSLSVNAYEQCKPKRRRRRKLLISVSNRAILLLAAGYSIDEIADASTSALEIKQGRIQSIQNQSWDGVNYMMETTGDVVAGMLLQPFQTTGKKLKSLMAVKPQQHSEGARMA